MADPGESAAQTSTQQGSDLKEWNGYFQEHQAAILEAYKKYQDSENVYARIVKEVFADFEIKPTNKQVNSFISNIRKGVKTKHGDALTSEEEFEHMKNMVVKQKRCRIHSGKLERPPKQLKQESEENSTVVSSLGGEKPSGSILWPEEAKSALRAALRNNDVVIMEVSSIGKKAKSVSCWKVRIVSVEDNGVYVIDPSLEKPFGADEKKHPTMFIAAAQVLGEDTTTTKDWRHFIWKLNDPVPDMGLHQLPNFPAGEQALRAGMPLFSGLHGGGIPQGMNQGIFSSASPQRVVYPGVASMMPHHLFQHGGFVPRDGRSLPAQQSQIPPVYMDQSFMRHQQPMGMPMVPFPGMLTNPEDDQDKKTS